MKATILHIRDHSQPAAPSEAVHALPADEFDGLASGRGSAEVVARLVEAQESVRRTLIARLIGTTRSDDTLAAACDLLVRLDAEAPDAVNVVLAHPGVRSWAAACLEDFEKGEAAPAGIGYLSNLAIAAAAHARATASVIVRAAADKIRFPSLGYAEVGGRGEAVVTIDGPHVEIARDGHTLRLDLDDPTPDPAWHPVLSLSAAADFPVRLDADESSAKIIKDTLPEAVDLLGRCFPDYLPGLRAAVRTITPDRAMPCDTVSAIALEPTASPADLALGIVRAFQRAKLHAVGDLFALIDPACPAAESKALEDLLYEAYELLAVGEFRLARREPLGERATGALEQLRDRPELTGLGRRFVAGMAHTAASWPALRARAAR